MVPGEFFFILQLAYNFNHGGIDTLFQAVSKHQSKVAKICWESELFEKGAIYSAPSMAGVSP